MSIEWVFFDVGDVLFSEDAPHILYFHSIHQAMRKHGLEISWDSFNAEIEASVKASPASFLSDAGITLSGGPEPWDAIFKEGRAIYDAIRKPRPYGVLQNGITQVVKALKPIFKVGVIANQHPEILDAFDTYDLTTLFDLIVIDEIVGVSKPDPAIFTLALEQAGCQPTNAIMVGDRTDNDIAPAKGVGMRTVRFRNGILYAHCDPLREAEVPDREVRELRNLEAAILEVAHSAA